MHSYWPRNRLKYMDTIVINWVVLLLVTIVSFVISGIWHGPIFGKLWMKLSDMTEADVTEAKKHSGMYWSYVVQFFVILLTNYVLYHFVKGAGLNLTGAFWVWLGFIATTEAADSIWNKLSTEYKVKKFLVTAGASLITILFAAWAFQMWG